MVKKIHIQGTMPGGAELAVAAMDEYSRAEIGRKTYRFVRRCMQDPELRAKIKARAPSSGRKEIQSRVNRTDKKGVI